MFTHLPALRAFTFHIGVENVQFDVCVALTSTTILESSSLHHKMELMPHFTEAGTSVRQVQCDPSSHYQSPQNLKYY